MGQAPTARVGQSQAALELGWACESTTDLCASPGCRLPSKLDRLNRAESSEEIDRKAVFTKR